MGTETSNAEYPYWLRTLPDMVLVTPPGALQGGLEAGSKYRYWGRWLHGAVIRAPGGFLLSVWT